MIEPANTSPLAGRQVIQGRLAVSVGRVPQMDTQEVRVRLSREAVEPWVQVAHSTRVIDHVLERTPAPSDESRFAKVDELYPAQAGSEWSYGYLSAALEHLKLWADYAAPLKFQEGQVVTHSLRPAQALARAAAESASQAVWIMAADGPTSSARRHLTLVLHDLDERRKASPERARQHWANTRAAAIDDLAAVTEVQALLNPPSYLTLIREASAEVIANGPTGNFPADVDEAERIWRASAGAMHGKRWPALEQTTSFTTEDGQQVRAPDPHAITRALQLALGIATHGVLRFVDYSGHSVALPDLLGNAFEEVAATVPLIDGASIDISDLKTRLRRNEGKP